MRADFYVGKGDNARWIGSVETDGYPATRGIKTAGVPQKILKCTKKAVFEKSLKRFIKKRKKNQWSHGNAWDESDGWPWNWTNSSYTDYSYWFFDKRVWIVTAETEYFPAALFPPKLVSYPLMRKNK